MAHARCIRITDPQPSRQEKPMNYSSMRSNVFSVMPTALLPTDLDADTHAGS